MGNGWDNATLKKLKSLTGKGLSTAEIGKRLGMSKNAIVGKLNRLGWNTSAATTPATVKVAPKKAPAKAPAKKVIAKKTTPVKPVKIAAKAAPATKAEVKNPKTEILKKGDSKSLAMHQRIIRHSMSMAGLKADQCRWPIGDPDSEDFHFCGAPVFAGKPYCYEHCKQAYQFTKK